MELYDARRKNRGIMMDDQRNPDFIDSKEKKKKSRSVKWLEATVTFSLFMIFFGLPLFFLNVTFQGLAFEKQTYFYLWALISLVAWVTKGVVAGEMKIRKTPLDMPIIFFWAVYVFGTIFSIDRWHSFWGTFGDPVLGLMNVTIGVMLYYVIFSHLNIKRIKWLIGAIVSSGVIVSFWSLLSVMDIYGFYGKTASYIPWNITGSATGLMIFISLIIPIITGVILKMTLVPLSVIKKIIVALLTLTVLADFFLLFALFSFLPIIGVFVGVSFFLIFVLARIISPKDAWSWLPMLAFVALIVIWLVNFNNNFNPARIQIQPEVFLTKGISWSIAKAELTEGVKSFFLGVGPANYGHVFSLHRPDSFIEGVGGDLRFYKASGLFFEFLSTLGVLGGIGLALVVLTFLSIVVYLMAKGKQYNKILSLGMTAGALAFVTNAFWTRVDGGILTFGALVSVLALVVLTQESQTEEKSFDLSLKVSSKFALTLAFIFMLVSAGVIFLFVFIGKSLTADIYLAEASKQTEKDNTASIDKIQRAISLYSLEGQYYLRLGQEYMKKANVEAMKEEKDRDLQAISSLVSASLSSGEKAKLMNPRDVATLFQLAQLYEAAAVYAPESLNKAKEQYEEALKQEPNNPTLYLKLGQADLALANINKDENNKKTSLEKAVSYFEQSVSIKKDFAEGYMSLSLAKRNLGDMDGAVTAMENAFRSASSNITYAFNLAEIYKIRGKDNDYKQAENLYKQILSVNPQEVSTLYSLGTLYEKMKRTDDALSYFQKSLEALKTVAPDDKTSQDKIAEIINQVKNGGSSEAQTMENVSNEVPTENNSQ